MGVHGKNAIQNEWQELLEQITADVEIVHILTSDTVVIAELTDSCLDA